ncbi:hypothetical protein BDR05DRAFT_1001557 [Suillus weaverae]|nr:hypothetical protein BDR05DRAFT_1001557 [Suillus weaverae]
MSNHDSASELDSNKQPPVIEDEAAVLQSYLEQWSLADAAEQRNVLRTAAAEARMKAPLMSVLLYKAQKETYEKWFHNHCKKKTLGKPPIKMGQKWTEGSIIDKLQKKELLTKIKNDTGTKPGSKEMMYHYTTQLNQLMASLLQEELEEAKEMAKEWNAKGVPAEIKVEIACKKGEDMIRHFASEMWNQAGMQVFILLAWKDEEKSHDYNQDFGGAEQFMKSWNWTVIQPEWDAYAANALDDDVDEDSAAQKKGRQDNTYKLTIGDDGYPIKPPHELMDLHTKKAVVQAFLTWPYRKCCGDPKVSVPWKYVIPQCSKIIPAEYLPEGHSLAEPSKLRQVHATELLQFWYDQQEEGEDHIFKFIGWWDSDAQDMVLAADKDDSVAIRERPNTKGPVKAAKAKPAKDISALLARHKGKGRTSKYLSSEGEFDDAKTTMNESCAKEAEESEAVVPTCRLTASQAQKSKAPAGNDSDSDMESSEGAGTIRRQNAPAHSRHVQMHDRLSTTDCAKKGLQTDKVKVATTFQAKKDTSTDARKTTPADRPKKGSRQDDGKAAALEHRKICQQVDTSSAAAAAPPVSSASVGIQPHTRWHGPLSHSGKSGRNKPEGGVDDQSPTWRGSLLQEIRLQPDNLLGEPQRNTCQRTFR